jgi:nitroimidazol reductase NimA-like FMN-containing flavoprotein (pyridoxamine 5'-phosphate oxidase superfamily)
MNERGAYDRATIDAILDATPLAHVGFVHGGQPFVTPTLQWREGDHVYWHGSAASRMLDKADGASVCLTVTVLDGFVLARSAFHHSVNYRSVMLIGQASLITDPEAKEARLKAFVDGLFPGRWDSLRAVNAQELKATHVLSMPIDEVSAKVRTGGPKDDAEDYELPIWAGVLPVVAQALAPIDDPLNVAGVAAPEHVKAFRFG